MDITMEMPVYLDHNATTPVDRRVLEKMLPYFCEVYGNAASIDHLHGNKAKQAVDEAPCYKRGCVSSIYKIQG
jgi:cysteine desulfurase